MFSPAEARDFKEWIAELKFELPTTSDEDARVSVATIVSHAFQENSGMTPEATDLVEEYKKLKPSLAAAMDAFVASGGTTEP